MKKTMTLKMRKRLMMKIEKMKMSTVRKILKTLTSYQQICHLILVICCPLTEL